jgi:glycosyltransferase involved in cell wall biosynthesis
VWAENNLLSNMFILPHYGNKLKLDALVFQNHPCYFSRFKRIAYIHDVLFLSFPEYYSVIERLYFAPLKFLARHSHFICTISNEEKNRLLKYGFSTDDNIDFIHHGVDNIFKPCEQYDPAYLNIIRSKYNLPEKFILFVGRLNIR